MGIVSDVVVQGESDANSRSPFLLAQDAAAHASRAPILVRLSAGSTYQPSKKATWLASQPSAQSRLPTSTKAAKLLVSENSATKAGVSLREAHRAVPASSDSGHRAFLVRS